VDFPFYLYPKPKYKRVTSRTLFDHLKMLEISLHFFRADQFALRMSTYVTDFCMLHREISEISRQLVINSGKRTLTYDHHMADMCAHF
jgi:hypothetical protein